MRALEETSGDDRILRHARKTEESSESVSVQHDNNDQVNNNNNEGEDNSLQATEKMKKVLKFTFGKRKTTAGSSWVDHTRRTAGHERSQMKLLLLLLLLLLVRLTATGRKKKWTFHVQGRVVNERDAEVDAREVLSSGGGGGLKFSHFIERMKIDVYD